MKTVICTKYEPPEVLKIMEVKTPKPKEKEVLIKFYATTAHVGDAKIRRLDPGMGPIKDFFFKPAMRLMLGFNRPKFKILGMDIAGKIVSVGKDVTTFQKGDQVFASSFEGYSFGVYAEYKCMAEDGVIAIKPATF